MLVTPGSKRVKADILFLSVRQEHKYKGELTVLISLSCDLH